MVVILLNFEILGEMEIKSTTPSLNEPPVKPAPKVQNENVEPKKEVPNAKSFFGKDNAPANPPPKANKPALSTPASTASNTTQSGGMFNNFKILEIKTLNPYQNK